MILFDEPMVNQIVGVDCATNPRRVGLARATRSVGSFRLAEALACSGTKTPANLIARWVREVPDSTLLALDAPLGWPVALGAALAEHRAGQPLDAAANLLFRRETDRDIARRFRKTPLDVGADRIARTAHWALRLLALLTSDLGEPIPLAWSTDFSGRVAAIEVYPAATLLAHGIEIRGYKGKAGTVERAGIFQLLRSRLELDLEGFADWTVDTLDAAVCVLAGQDFLSGAAKAPGDPLQAAKEGWIWDPVPTPSS